MVCCGIVNRGAALFDGKLYRTTLDAYVIALDITTGKEVWRTKSADPQDGYLDDGRAARCERCGHHGVAGAEFGHRGYLEGLIPRPASRYGGPTPFRRRASQGLRRGPVHPCRRAAAVPGSPGPMIRHSISLFGDRQSRALNPLGRKGDNLYTNAILAIQPSTGKVVWWYQMTPNDPFDYDGVNELVQAELTIEDAASGHHAGEPQWVPVPARCAPPASPPRTSSSR